VRLAQILGGYCMPAAAVHHDPSLDSRIAADGSSYDGGYGPFVAEQIEPLIDHLRRRPESRRGMLWLARPPSGLEIVDVPTVLGAQFLIRDGRLAGIVYSRSLDFLGSLSIDCGIFAALLAMLASELNLYEGNLTIVVGSCHAYLEDLQNASAARSKVGFLPAIDVSRANLLTELAKLRDVEDSMRSACAARNFTATDIDWQPKSLFVAWLLEALRDSHHSHTSSQ
jgi:Thymidylate synthase